MSFGGEVVEEDGKRVWKPSWSVRAIPVDYMVPGYESGLVNTLRLWQARSYDEFDLLTFNKSEYLYAFKPQVKAENISKILYPEDSTEVCKELRLEQQYFFASASIHDEIRVFYPNQDKPGLEQQYFFASASIHDEIRVFYPNQDKPDLTTFPDKICVQLNDTHPVIGIPELMRILLDNDTHPVIGIPELMRILLDEYGYDWDTAWNITTKTFN